MPLHKIIYPSPDSQIAIWRIDEDLEALLSLSHNRKKSEGEIEGFKSEKRKKEWVAVRLLHQHLLPGSTADIRYTEHRKPYLDDDHPSHIAISHAGDLVALMVHQKKMVGMDLEEIRPNIQVVREKFLSENEKKFAAKENIEQLIVMWSAKESIYKLHGTKTLSFANNILLESFDLKKRGRIPARLKRNELNQAIQIEYLLLENIYLTWCTE